MLKFDEKTGYLTIPGLRDRIRVRDGWIDAEDGWRRVANEEEEAIYAVLRSVAATGNTGDTVQGAPTEAGGAQDGEADLVALVHAYGESIRDFHTDPKGLRGSCAGNVMKAEADLIAALGRLRSLPLSEAMAPAGDLRKLLREARDNAIASLAETGISDERREYRAGLAKRLDAALVALPLSEGPKAAIICSECGQGPLHAMACSHSYVNKPVAPHHGQEGAP